jgi:hypothetical protein
MMRRLTLAAVLAAALGAGSASAAGPPKTLLQSPCGSSAGWKVYALRVPCGTAKQIVADAAASPKQHVGDGQIGRTSSHGLACVYTARGNKAAIECLSGDTKKIVLAVKR